MKKHYVYRITNKIENKHYYGCRTTKLEPKDDLGSKYFSSSRDKEFIKDQKENPYNYKYKIIKIFSTREEAIELEIKLHNKFNVGINESFYNRAKQSSLGFDTSGIKYSDERKERIRKRMIENNHFRGKKLSDEHKLKLSLSHMGSKNHNYGLEKTAEIKKKISESNKGKVMSQEAKQKISIANTGKTRTQEIKEKISNALKGRTYTQEHCNNISAANKGRKVSVEGRANMSMGQKGKIVWNKGLVNAQSHSKETKDRLSDYFSKTKWITNGTCNKRVIISKIETLDDGWVFGKCKKTK